MMIRYTTTPVNMISWVLTVLLSGFLVGNSKKQPYLQFAAATLVTTFVNDYSFNTLVLSPGYPGRADNKSNNRATLSEPLKKSSWHIN